MNSIWAVAANTVKQALRMKIAVIFVLLLMVLLPVMAFSTTGDYTLKGRLQTFVSYGLSLTSLLLSLLTIIISIYTITAEIEHRQIYTVITKPIRRSQFILGKLFGVLLLSVGLLVLFSAAIYAVAVYMPRYSKAPESELIEADNEFFTARYAMSPAEVDVSKEVDDALRKLQTGGGLEQVYADMSDKEIIAQLTNLNKLAKRSADVGYKLSWRFENVRPRDPNGSVFVRFKYEVSVSPRDSQIFGQWRIGDNSPNEYGIDSDTPLYHLQRKDPIRTFREIEVPANAVAPDGHLDVIFFNDPLNSTSVVFPLKDGLTVLYRADSFTANYVRAILLVLFRLVFLACLGTLAATFLSFPVAILLCLALFFAASVSSFAIESFRYVSENVTLFYSYTFDWMLRLLPQFDKYHPSKYVVSGQLLSWPVVGRAVVLMVCIKSLLLLALALIIFSFKEIARIVV